ncbi:MAG: hypothetical protein LJE84_11430 [Gammaproteobacteria bacterium]|nr:hypothetical protein [Gammaproteobacteria bacterium]
MALAIQRQGQNYRMAIQQVAQKGCARPVGAAQENSITGKIGYITSKPDGGNEWSGSAGSRYFSGKLVYDGLRIGTYDPGREDGLRHNGKPGQLIRNRRLAVQSWH